jgi:hypothetical protein
MNTQFKQEEIRKALAGKTLGEAKEHLAKLESEVACLRNMADTTVKHMRKRVDPKVNFILNVFGDTELVEEEQAEPPKNGRYRGEPQVARVTTAINEFLSISRFEKECATIVTKADSKIVYGKDDRGLLNTDGAWERYLDAFYEDAQTEFDEREKVRLRAELVEKIAQAEVNLADVRSLVGTPDTVIPEKIWVQFGKEWLDHTVRGYDPRTATYHIFNNNHGGDLFIPRDEVLLDEPPEAPSVEASSEDIDSYTPTQEEVDKLIKAWKEFKTTEGSYNSYFPAELGNGVVVLPQFFIEDTRFFAYYRDDLKAMRIQFEEAQRIEALKDAGVDDLVAKDIALLEKHGIAYEILKSTQFDEWSSPVYLVRIGE